MCFSYRKYIAKTNQQAQGSKHAGNHFQPARTTPTSKARTRTHQPARHEVQGMQITTSNKDTRADTNQQAQGSRYAGNHFNQGHEPGTRGSRYAGNHFQPGHQPQGHTKTHEPARHKVQGMQVTTSNKHEPQGDTSQQGTRFKACR